MIASCRIVESPVGPLALVVDGGGLSEIRFTKTGPAPAATEETGDRAAVLAEAQHQLDAYFAGRLRRFDLPLAPAGTPFQIRVWDALREIPFGSTTSYGELARRLGNPAASRAVGAANGRNPLPIVVPCHRVVGSDGSLTGFGGGLEIKQALLDHEHRALHPTLPFSAPLVHESTDPGDGPRT